MADAVPRYVANPLLRFFDDLEQSMQLLHLSMHGISVLRAMPTVVEVLSDLGAARVPEDQHQAPSQRDPGKLAMAKAEADLANRECQSGFPLLHAHTLVGIWGALEAAIEDALIGILMNEPALLQYEAFAKIRIPLAEFEILDKEERMRRLVYELERGQGVGRRQGADAFEMLLDPVRLAGEIDPEAKKAMWEMHHLRNTIVHRGSIADRRLVEACPWLDLGVGAPVIVTHDSLMRYGEILGQYVMTITRRLSRRYNVDIDKLIQNAEQKKKEKTNLCS